MILLVDATSARYRLYSTPNGSRTYKIPKCVTPRLDRYTIAAVGRDGADEGRRRFFDIKYGLRGGALDLRHRINSR